MKFLQGDSNEIKAQERQIADQKEANAYLVKAASFFAGGRE